MTASPPSIATRAALYLRVSTARQAEHDVSIPDQKRQGEAYCLTRGYQLVDTFVEPGASATNDRRPEFQRMIEAGNRRGLPLVCANPDLARITPDGLKPGAGAIAARYAARGGEVHYVGKPHREIYAHCLALAAGRALGVGDSLHHDVAGGAAAGIDTLLVMNGVHAAELPNEASAATLVAAMRRIVGDQGVLPDWAAPAFRW